MKEIFIQILAQPIPKSRNLLPRQKELSAAAGDKIRTVIGPRRSGKSSILLRDIYRLLGEGVPENKIVWINFEDDRIEWPAAKADEMLQARAQLHPEIPLEECYIYIDEVQNAPNWERFIRRLHDTPCKAITITGSNSKLLATEVHTSLRGRGWPLKILPLGFREYLLFRNIEPAEHGRQRPVVLAAFYDFLQQGGFPEIVSRPATEAGEILQDYYNAMLFRDLIERYHIGQPAICKYMLARVAASIGKPLSLRKIFNELKSNGYKLATNFLYELADMSQAAYFFKRISRFDFSLVKREMSDKKAYFIDNGMINAITLVTAGNKGLLFENAIFWELYRRYGNLYTTDIYYYKDSVAECDFVLYREGGTPILVQVCYTLADPDTKEREIRGLIKACTACKVKEGWLITPEEEGTIEREGITISIKAAWKWVLQ